MYYGSGTVAHTASQWRHTRQVIEAFREMTSWPPSWKYDAISGIQHRQSMRIHLTNISAKFHPNRIWNDGALGFFGRGHKLSVTTYKKHKNNNKMSSDMGSKNTVYRQWRKASLRDLSQWLLLAFGNVFGTCVKQRRCAFHSSRFVQQNFCYKTVHNHK